MHIALPEPIIVMKLESYRGLELRPDLLHPGLLLDVCSYVSSTNETISRKASEILKRVIFPVIDEARYDLSQFTARHAVDDKGVLHNNIELSPCTTCLNRAVSGLHDRPIDLLCRCSTIWKQVVW